MYGHSSRGKGRRREVGSKRRRVGRKQDRKEENLPEVIQSIGART